MTLIKITYYPALFKKAKLSCRYVRRPNLLSNAIKYGAGKPIHVNIITGVDKVKLIVKDFGIGISSNDQARIFGRFERAVDKDKITGLGLGLYIVKEILDAHGGKIKVNSALGKGATFIVDLPF